MMSSTYAGFIDAGFLRAEGARALGESPRNVRLDAEAIVTWYRALAFGSPGRFLRAYWYDARFEEGHDHAEGQGRFFAALGLTPGIQLRLGTHRRTQAVVRARHPGCHQAYGGGAGSGSHPGDERIRPELDLPTGAQAEGCRHPRHAGSGPVGQPPGVRHRRADLRRPRPRGSGADGAGSRLPGGHRYPRPVLGRPGGGQTG